MTYKDCFPKLDCKYGAPLGRPNTLPEDISKPQKLHLRVVRMVSSDYDSGNAYWGGYPSPPLFVAYNDETIVFVRGDDREEAKENVQNILPNAKFYR